MRQPNPHTFHLIALFCCSSFTFYGSLSTRNTKGRKIGILCGDASIFARAFMNARAQNIAMLIIGRCLLGVGIGFDNQVGGFSLLVKEGRRGFGSGASLWSLTITSGTLVVATFISMAFADKFGRRALFLEAGVEMIICMLSNLDKELSYQKESLFLVTTHLPDLTPADDDIEEQTSRWKETGKPKEEIYSNSKIVQVIKTYWELGHEHKFITEIVARRANDCIVSITELDYKNLNKNNIEDIYLLIMNGKVPDYADTWLLWSLSVFIRSAVIWEIVHDFQLGIERYQQKVNLTAPTITFPGTKEHDMFSIIYEPVHGIIYKNSKKEKRVMRHIEIHKFCDATLNRVLEGLKSYNNDVKYGYVQKDETEYLKLFEEEIEASKVDEKMGDVRE
ncbi:zinc finger, CCHC-type containing protein [Tanacetum coccineum]